MSTSAKKQQPLVVVIHGGAWKVPQHLTDASVKGVVSAARAGMQHLLASHRRHRQQKQQDDEDHHEDDDPTLSAAVAAVRVLEDNEAFDAGRGSTLTLDGKVEMDAMVACIGGKQEQQQQQQQQYTPVVSLGSVACISQVRNPIQVAQQVLHSNHCLLVGDGARRFAAERGCDLIEDKDDYLVTAAMRAELEQLKRYGNVVHSLFNGGSEADDEMEKQSGHDTVGCVVYGGSIFGGVACATSTGGITAKRPGRVGDSPLFGAGGYCAAASDDNAEGEQQPLLAACSTTGHGESIQKALLAKEVVDGVVRNSGGTAAAAAAAVPMQACVAALDRMKRTTRGGCGGAIAVDSRGRFGMWFTTERMPWAVAVCYRYDVGDNAAEEEFELMSGIDPDSLKELMEKISSTA